MAAAAYSQKFIERIYPPEELVTASPGRRLGGYLFDVLLLVVTFFVGWLIWFIFTAPNGQTPGKQILGMYTMKADGTRAGGGYTWLRELVIKGIVTSLISSITCGIYSILAPMWCLWDKDRQCLWDKMGSTYIAYSPRKFKPLTASELTVAGRALPVVAIAPPPPPPAPAVVPPAQEPAAPPPTAVEPPAPPPAAEEAAAPPPAAEDTAAPPPPANDEP